MSYVTGLTSSSKRCYKAVGY